ncbi:MAG: MmcQ/YjbR family DNA-binding protein [Pseudorhodoplanes sp.]
MADAGDFRRIALALEGTKEAPHFDRRAFRVNRIYATLAADRRTANLKFLPEDQALKCTVAPEAFQAVPGGWGRQGWTTAVLSELKVRELEQALEIAWRLAVPKTPWRRS